MLTTAFILGLAGSLHCAGMCSPLAFALTGMRKSAWANRMIYNSGRIFTYGFLGAIVSALGVALPLEKFQSVLSIGMGVILILVGLVGVRAVNIPILTTALNRLSIVLKNRFSNLIQKKSSSSIIFLGVLNGLLPCGLTLIALTTCLILPDSRDGFYFMLVFGAGTLPVMVGFLSLVQFLINRFKFSFRRVNTIMLIAAGTLLIARVIYFEHSIPKLNASDQGIVVCP